MTDIPSREYFERIIRDMELRQDQRVTEVTQLAAVHRQAHLEEHAAHRLVHQRELEVSSDKVQALETRLTGMNEFRATLNDAQKTYVTRDMIDQRDKSLGDRLGLIENKSANLDGRMAMFAALPILVSVAGLIIALTR